MIAREWWRDKEGQKRRITKENEENCTLSWFCWWFHWCVHTPNKCKVVHLNMCCLLCQVNLHKAVTHLFLDEVQNNLWKPWSKELSIETIIIFKILPYAKNKDLVISRNYHMNSWNQLLWETQRFPSLGMVIAKGLDFTLLFLTFSDYK